MQLSTRFSIDTTAPWVQEHNREVRDVLAAFQADRPIRVPLVCGEWRGQHGFYAQETDLDYCRYYSDPDVMIAVQLEAARRRRELPIYDLVLGETPKQWAVGVDFWPVVAPGWLGCRLVLRSDSVIAHEGLRLSKEDADAMVMPDPIHGAQVKTNHEFWTYLCEKYRDFRYLGKPLEPIGHGVGTNGFFSTCLDVRGEALMADMYDDPAFAHRFLEKIAGWCQTLDCTWDRLAGDEAKPGTMGIGDHGIDMLSAEMYEEFIVSLNRTMAQRHGMTFSQDLHHCGHGAHLFPVIKRCFGLKSINALTWPYVDIAKVRLDLGEEVWIQAIIADSIIQMGPAERIRDAVREIMKAKGKGRFSLMVGDMLRGTPIEHRKILYEAVKEFGRY